ncbi:hypothetical protein BD410DRAFT_820528 [Rickenella mellea]|uniref:Adenylate kinase n=1 Tax=Rickenella mellea TaxID=50990 RepID=A0A4Y7Q952_9AGAM|nr:hypothetical protein BD410DRAFT_820528 [Rickenella mellea]
MSSIPPLKGDEKHNYRVHIVGNSGESTLAKELAEMLGVPSIHMDRVFWKPGWQEPTNEEFAAKLRALLDQYPDGWVIDGNYDRRGGTLVGERATDVIWLDPPLLLYFPRICYRTFLRLLRIGEPCAPGCNETISEVFFSKESIIWWCLSHHWVSRKKNGKRMEEGGVDVGGNMRRIGGWGHELEEWKKSVQRMIQS